MRLLLDTNLLLWTAIGSNRLPSEVRPILEDRENRLLFSVVSVWEIAIKQGLGRKDFPYNAHVIRLRLLENGFQELPVRGEHATAINLLPSIHKDPFDRLLIAQAMVEGLLFYTSDIKLAKYDGPVRTV